MVSRRLACGLGIAGVAFLTTPAFAQAIEVPLKYHADSSELEELFISGHGFVQVLEECPEGEWKLPDFKTEEPRFGIISLGDSEFLLALDKKMASDEFYTRIYVDANGNGDLTDDDVLDGELMSISADDSFFYVVFDSGLDLEFELGGEKMPYRLRFTVQGQDLTEIEVPEGVSFESIFISIESTCSYAGEFKSGDETYQVVLSDGNCNGRFTDVFSIDENTTFPARYPIYPTGDRMYLTSNDELTYDDSFSLGSHLLLGTKLFDVGLDVAGGKLVLTPTAGELVPLTLAMLTDRMTLDSRKAGQAVMMYRPGTVASLPPGDYRPLSYQLHAMGKHDDEWFLTAGATSDTPFVTLPAGGEATLEFGPPFTALAEINSYSVRALKDGASDEVHISFNVEGAAKELLTNLSRTEGTKSGIEMSFAKANMPLEPRYVIYTGEGKKVKSGSFEYG